MSPSDLIELSKQKNEAKRRLSQKSQDARMMSLYKTVEDKNYEMKSMVAPLQEEYDNLCDKYDIWFKVL